jgi:hypothetical protein
VKKKFLLFITILFSHYIILAQETRTIVFYGPVTSSSDMSTTKLTSDLFYSQIATLPGYSLVDKRQITWQDSYIQEEYPVNTILFYVEIHENGTNWDCTLTAIDGTTKSTYSKTATYEGYYKILMEAKSSLTSLLEGFTSSAMSTPVLNDSTSKNTNIKLSLDTLSGTWEGENLISKIVILRGGRGFVIYKNGASMNIAVSITNNKVEAIQTSKQHASFFPDLPREVALLVAANAEPIKWTLSLIDENTLTGEKVTLMPVDNNAQRTIIPVKWIRVQ